MISVSKWITGVAAACAVASCAWAQDNSNDNRKEDDSFLLLREAVRKGEPDKAEFYASRLANYSIPSYVDYYRLKSRFRDATTYEIREYLKRYEGSAIADRLRNDWLLDLGRKKDWPNFDDQYPQFVLNDDTQVKCYALQSKALKGYKVADEARVLLTAPAGYGEPCAGLIATLYEKGQFSADDVWAQVRLAGEANATGQARRAALLVGGVDKKITQAVDLPTVAISKGPGVGRADHETFLVAVGRAAKTSMKLAVAALNKAAPSLTAQEQAIGWANLGLQSSYSLAPETADYWRRSEGAPLSPDQHQWKTRFALRSGDWQQVKKNIAAMPEWLRNDPAWVYWKARAIMAQGPAQSALHPTGEAAQLLRGISDQPGFYGQLALEELGQMITIPAPGAPVSPAEIQAVAARPGFQRALKFFGLRLRFEGTREWNWELRSLNEREHLAAAEFARQQHILDRMVNTSDRTRVQVDYTQRFPSPHDDIMHPATQTLGLDKAWVYGLIRQESRFIMDAQSTAGASGLMQVMPSTARWLAKKLGVTDYAHDAINDVRTNIMLGTNYMNMVLGNMDGSQVLATAAYNAGPGRLRSWRAVLDKPMESAIFIESIPFYETRTYVKNVMSNATWYAALFEGRPQSLKARIGVVGPRGYTEQERQEASYGGR